MRFRLTYEGQLKSNQSKNIAQHKHEIRTHFHPQLQHLWSIHSPLSMYKDSYAKSFQYSLNEYRVKYIIPKEKPRSGGRPERGPIRN